VCGCEFVGLWVWCRCKRGCSCVGVGLSVQVCGCGCGCGYRCRCECRGVCVCEWVRGCTLCMLKRFKSCAKYVPILESDKRVVQAQLHHCDCDYGYDW